MMELVEQIRTCVVCKPFLEAGVNPVISIGENSPILIIGQAPGKIVHETSIPWNDKSGVNLRKWLGVSEDQFYNTGLFSIVPMGFCYPGKGRSGDLPPRAECAPRWHAVLLSTLQNVKLTILIGQYAQAYYLKEKMKHSLTETVRHYHEYLPTFFPLPHPSPRNNIWMAKNKWFGDEVLPELQHLVKEIIA